MHCIQTQGTPLWQTTDQGNSSFKRLVEVVTKSCCKGNPLFIDQVLNPLCSIERDIYLRAKACRGQRTHLAILAVDQNVARGRDDNFLLRRLPVFVIEMPPFKPKAQFNSYHAP